MDYAGSGQQLILIDFSHRFDNPVYVLLCLIWLVAFSYTCIRSYQMVSGFRTHFQTFLTYPGCIMNCFTRFYFLFHQE